LKINTKMAINYKQVENIINQQYVNTKKKDGSLSLNSLYYDFFKQLNISNMLSDNILTNGILKMLGVKSDEEKQQDKMDISKLTSKYPIVYDKVKYKYYGK
tara:strand:+ start:1010 stop:1312 length:303 start_codon:yes stop_codon:yes gene_type:complete